MWNAPTSLTDTPHLLASVSLRAGSTLAFPSKTAARFYLNAFCFINLNQIVKDCKRKVPMNHTRRKIVIEYFLQKTNK